MKISERISEAKQQAASEGRELTAAEMQALLNLAENLATQEQAGELTFRVAPSGGVSVYGLGRFPTTLYPDQWDRILTKAAELQDFIAKNKASLKYKTPKAPKPEVAS